MEGWLMSEEPIFEQLGSLLLERLRREMVPAVLHPRPPRREVAEPLPPARRMPAGYKIVFRLGSAGKGLAVG